MNSSIRRQSVGTAQSDDATVFIIDDDLDFSSALAAFIASLGLKTKCFSSPDEYIQQFDPTIPGCLILDVRMPKASGLAVQERLNKLPFCPAILFMTRYAEVSTALRAMRQGAVDFLQKHASKDELYEALQRAIAQDLARRITARRNDAIAARFAELTGREEQVLGRVLQGWPNKTIASRLGVSLRTVEDRRARVMHKLRVANFPALVRIAIEANFHRETVACAGSSA